MKPNFIMSFRTSCWKLVATPRVPYMGLPQDPHNHLGILPPPIHRPHIVNLNWDRHAPHLPLDTSPKMFRIYSPLFDYHRPSDNKRTQSTSSRSLGGPTAIWQGKRKGEIIHQRDALCANVSSPEAIPKSRTNKSQSTDLSTDAPSVGQGK